MSSLVLARGLAALLVLTGGLTRSLAALLALLVLTRGLAALLVLAGGLAALLVFARALAIFTYMSGWASASSTYCCWGACASSLTLRATLHSSYTSCINISPLTAGIITDLWYSIQYYWARLEGFCSTCISKRTKRCRGSV